MCGERKSASISIGCVHRVAAVFGLLQWVLQFAKSDLC